MTGISSGGNYISMNLSSINLNLLVILNALLTERSVTKAAKKIHLSQSRTSNALNQLRELFDDELLERKHFNKMDLTPKARKIQSSLDQIILDIKGLFVDNTQFYPEEARLNLNIAMCDYASALIFPLLIDALRESAPNITVSMFRINSWDEYYGGDYKNYDLAIGLGPDGAENKNVEPEILSEDSVVYVADTRHPVFLKPQLTEESLKDYPHLLIEFNRDIGALNEFDGKELNSQTCRSIYWLNEVDSDHSEIGLDGPGTTKVSIQHMMIAMKKLVDSDWICITPKKLIENILGFYNLAVRPLPYDVPVLKLLQYSRAADRNSSLHCWLREIVRNLTI